MSPNAVKPRTKAKEEAKAERVKRFANCLALEELALNRIDLQVTRENAQQKGKLDLDLNVDTEFRKDEVNTYFEATAKCALSGKTQDDEHIFNLSLEYFVLYRCTEVHDWPADELDFFAERNLMVHVWPYLREIIDQATRRANLNRLLLPILPPSAGVPKRDKPAKK